PTASDAPAEDRERERQERDRRRRVEAQLRPAIRLLIEIEPVPRGGEHHRGEREQREDGAEISAAATLHRQLQPEQQSANERDGGDELEETTAGVRAVRDRGRVERVTSAEEIRELQGDEGREERRDENERDRRALAGEHRARPRCQVVTRYPPERGHRAGHWPRERERDQQTAGRLGERIGDPLQIEDVLERPREHGVGGRE